MMQEYGEPAQWYARRRAEEAMRQLYRERLDVALGEWLDRPDNVVPMGTRADRQRTQGTGSDPVQARHEALTAAHEQLPAPSALSGGDDGGSVWGVSAWWQWPVVAGVLVAAVLLMVAWVVWSLGVMVPLYGVYHAAGGLRWVMEHTPVIREATR